MIQTYIASYKDDIHAIYHLRYTIYCFELQSFKPEDYPQQEECDYYDDYAIHVIAKDGTDVIGALRLVPDNPHGFVMDDAFALPDFIDRAKTVEHSRGIISKAYRSKGIYTQMLECAYVWQRQNNYPICIGAPNTAGLYHILKKHHWVDIGTPTLYHNITVVPMMFELI